MKTRAILLGVAAATGLAVSALPEREAAERVSAADPAARPIAAAAAERPGTAGSWRLWDLSEPRAQAEAVRAERERAEAIARAGIWATPAEWAPKD